MSRTEKAKEFQTLTMNITENFSEPVTSGEEKTIRNLYAEVISTAIHDLKRGLRPRDPNMKEALRISDMVNRRLALEWFAGTLEDCAISFADCLEVLDLHKKPIINALVLKGLIPDSSEAVKAIENDPNCPLDVM